jgi:hypothetical protein
MNFRLVLKIFVYTLALVIGVYIVILASGFKYDRNRGAFVHTGTIYISSTPRDVAISLNGYLKATKAPFKLTYLLPGDYTITVEKDGFKKWQKKVTVKPGLVTNEDEIILFYNNPGEISSSNIEGIKGFDLSEARDKVVFWTKDTIYQQRVDSTESEKVAELVGQEILDLQASPTFDKYLVSRKDTATGEIGSYFCREAKCIEPFNLDKGLNVVFNKVILTQNDSYPLLAVADGNLYAISKDLAKTYIESKVINFASRADRVFYYRTLDNQIKADWADFEGKNKNNILSFDDQGTQMKEKLAIFIDKVKNRIFLIGDGGKLYLLNNNFKDTEKVTDGANYLNFDNKNLLLIQNDNELQIQGRIAVTDEDKSVHLVARYSVNLRDPNWLLKTNHMIFVKGDELEVVDKNGSNSTAIYKFSGQTLNSGTAVSQSEVLVLDNGRLKKIKVCEENSLINFW